MMDWQEFLAMGGHAFYVWTSYGAVTAVMLYHWLAPVLRQRRLVRDIHQQIGMNKGTVA